MTTTSPNSVMLQLRLPVPPKRCARFALWRSQGSSQYFQVLSKQCLAKFWLPKSLYMSYEVLFITKGGVTLDIPLCDSWTTLMTLYITYDC